MSRPTTKAWRCRTRTVELSAERPFLLGILNLTPDSFSDGGKYRERSAAVRHAITLCEEGSDGVDVGGESTRPGAEPISAKEERARVIPILRELRKERPDIFLSIDTYKAEVARAAVEEAGVEVVNDVGGGRWDEAIWATVAEMGTGYVCMHAGGRPKEMQLQPNYGEVVIEVEEFLGDRLAALGRVGVEEEKVVLDVGIGFGKNLEHNLALLQADWSGLSRPLLWGLSRKSFLEATKVEKKLKDRPAALDVWHRELLKKNLPMVWRVHEPGRVRAGVNR